MTLLAVVSLALVAAAVSATPALADFGFLPGAAGFDGSVTNQDGSPDTQAGSHPYAASTSFTFGTTTNSNGEEVPDGNFKDVRVDLPPGFVGDPAAVAKCSAEDFATQTCPVDSQVGEATVSELGLTFAPGPVYNMVPPFGVPAEFAFEVAKVRAFLVASVRTGGDYGVTVSATEISRQAPVIGSSVTFWGVPADPSHNAQRCKVVNQIITGCGIESDASPKPFLTLPTSCTGPTTTTISADSWQNPGVFVEDSFLSHDNQGNPIGLDGCNQLNFSPTIDSQPTTNVSAAPTGLSFDLDVPQNENPEGLAEAHLKNIVVTLPEGLTINPSAGVGLSGCTPADYASETVTSAPGAGCPNESKLGTVEVNTPLLSTAIHGSLFIAQPYENPFSEPGHPNGSLVALYVVLKNPETGILIKLAGKVTPNPVTGQLSTTFENNPQLPFDHFNFHFREGAQAPLISPPACGTYTTQAQLTSWSEPTAVLTDTASFTITKGYEGGECPSGGGAGGIPFKPQIQSGTLNNSAGAFSPLYVHLTRTDADQEISGFSTNLPPGLTGDLTGIPFCPEADIALARSKTGAEEEANPSCPVASEIGHTLVGTGVGAVLAYVPGKVYLAGPFEGAPFSVVSVTSAVVGPFDLGTVVLRFGLSINPYTAQVSVEPSSSEPIPTIIDGIVTHVRDIRVYINRPDFIINPTSCDPMSIGSTLTSSLGASATISSPFQAASCASLKFAPKFAVSTQAKTSKADGASLHVDLTYPSAPQGTYADIAKVKVDLPKQLPSRLTTLQKACTAKQFEANPAGCPPESAIGTAKAVVPNIPEPLTGPVYFVSHGGEAFPSLEIVLQGYGVKVILVGATFISKAGVTSSTFNAIPDNPVTSFELTLPEGPYSALGTNKDLCSLTHTVTVKKKITKRVKGKLKKLTTKTTKTVTEGLVMPTAFVGQNGAEIHENTPVSVTGCPKVKLAKKAKKKKGKGKKKKK
jgi:hypothetical protein